MDNPVQGTAETLKSAFSTAIEAGSAMHPGGSANSLFSGGGEMGQLMRALDWSQTPVGPVSQWPHSLRTAVRIILNSRYAMFVWWGRELVNLYNDPYRAFLGTKHPHALGKSASEVWNEIWDQIGPRTEAVLLRGESTYDEALLLLMERHGYLEETYFTFSYSPLPDDEGTIGGLFCAVTEETQKVIGERRLAVLREIAAAMAESRTTVQVCQSAARSLVQAQRDLPFSAIYILGHDGKALSRMGEAGVCESHPAAPDLVRLDDGAECVWPFRKVMESGEPVFVDSIPANVAELPKGEWEHPPRSVILLPLAQQGQSRPAGVFLAGLNPYRKFDDDFRGFLSLLSNQIASGIANAIAYETERRRAESLAELDRAKTTFFSNVSHEFRTPLTLLLGPVEEALADTNRSSIDMKRLQVVHRNGLRLLKLVNSLLDFSRIEAGRVKASFEPVDISTLTSDLASGFRSLIERAGLTLNVDCPPLSRRVFVDREMWEKIVLNLLSNAFKFTFHGTVAISQRLVDEHVVLTVKDTGTGIPKRELANVFERFHRIEGAKGRSFGGTGIGLALVQELVKLHNGSINVESEEGVGTTFTVTVPAGSAQGSLDSAARSTERRSASTRLDLYVEEASRLRDQHPVCCLEGEVRQVLSNMVGNAIDALPSGGRLIVRSRDGRRHSDGREGIYITVADAGVGMTASVKERLFDAFFTTKQGTGTGLGLWISRNIIEKHDGTIRFRSSQGPRRHGTVFRVFLPYDAMREESSAANNVAVGSV